MFPLYSHSGWLYTVYPALFPLVARYGIKYHRYIRKVKPTTAQIPSISLPIDPFIVSSMAISGA